MKKLIISAGLGLAFLVFGHSHARASGTYFDTAAVVNVSSQTSAPTRILAPTSGPVADIRIICTQFSLSGETILLASSSTTFSVSGTTGTARIPCLPATVQQLDFTLDNYTGPLYAVANASYTIPVSIWRKR